MTAMSTSLCRGESISGKSKGKNRNMASHFPGIALGSSKMNAPAIASDKFTKFGSGNHTNARGQALTFSRHHQSNCIAPALNCQKNVAVPRCIEENKSPSNASGTTIKLIQGIPTRLVIGPNSEVSPKNHIDSGSRPSKAIHWDWKNIFICCHRVKPACPVLDGKHQTNQATPTKLSQKPGAKTANGSYINIAMSAKASDCEIRMGLLESFATATTAIIRNVRHVGKAKPAKAV